MKKMKWVIWALFAVVMFAGCPLPGGDTGDSDGVVDSDGDGYSDAEERETYFFDPDNNPLKFNPYIADLPQLKLEMTSLPVISLNATKSGETSRSIETSWSSTDESSFSRSNTSSAATTIGHTAGVSIGVEHEFGLFGGTTVNAQASYEFSHSHETGTSMTSAMSSTRSSTAAEATTLTETEGYELSGGKLKVYITIGNTSNISYTLNSLTLSAIQCHPYDGSHIVPIANLTYDGLAFPVTTLAPSQAMTAVYSGDVDTDTALDLLKKINNVTIRVSSYEVVDENGRAFNHNMTAVEARTSSLLIDYGIRGLLAPERYKISPDFADETPVSLKSVFDDVLRLSYEEGTRTVDDNELDMITSVRGQAAGSTDYPGYWVLFHTYSNGGIYETRIYSPMESYATGDIFINRGDDVILMYMEDRDADGLLAREEFAYGTSDQDNDSDGDGTSDFEEVEAGTNPAIDESDDDGGSSGGTTTPSLGEIGSAAVNLNSTDRTKAVLTWTNPSSSTHTLFRGVMVVRGEGSPVTGVPQSGQSYGVGDYITDPSDNSKQFEIVYLGDASSFTNSGLPYGKTYHYKIFATDMQQGIGQNFSDGVSCSVKTDIQVTVTLDSIDVLNENDGSGKCELYWTIKVNTPQGTKTLSSVNYSNHWSTYEAVKTDFTPGTVTFTLPQVNNESFSVSMVVKEYDDGGSGDDLCLDYTRTHKVYDSYISGVTGTFPNMTFNYDDQYWYESLGWAGKTFSKESNDSEDSEVEVTYSISASH